VRYTALPWRLIKPAAATTSPPTRGILKTWPDIKDPCPRSLSVSLCYPLFFSMITLIFHSAPPLVHITPSLSPSANFLSTNSPPRENVFRSGERVQTSITVRASAPSSSAPSYRHPTSRSGGRIVAVYSRVIREREFGRVLESFASLIESRQQERRRHQKMDKLLASEFVLHSSRFLFSPRKLVDVVNRAVLVGAFDRNFCLSNRKNVCRLRMNRIISCHD